MNANITTVVIYHGGCPDGTAAAWALSLYLDNTKTYYHYGKFKEQYPNVKDKDVIFVDFSYPLDITLKMLQEVKSMTVLDHHETAKQLQFITDPRLTLHLDMDRSGAQMAWDFAMEKLAVILPITRVPAQFGTNPVGDFPTQYASLDSLIYVEGRPRPWFIDDIADRDLWRWLVPGSKDTTRRMFSMGVYEKINSFYSLLNTSRDEIAAQGAILNADDDRIYSNIVKSATDCLVTSPDGKQQWKVRAVECDHSYASEAGNRLVQDGLCDFALAYRYNLPKDEWWISCRASPGSSLDLTRIVTLFDSKAGGHPKASGMTLSGSESLRKLLVPVAVKFVDAYTASQKVANSSTN